MKINSSFYSFICNITHTGLHAAVFYFERTVWNHIYNSRFRKLVNFFSPATDVKEACELAQAMQIPNLVLWHTEDSNIAGRERLYKNEGKKYYSGNLYVPDDESLIAL